MSSAALSSLMNVLLLSVLSAGGAGVSGFTLCGPLGSDKYRPANREKEDSHVDFTSDYEVRWLFSLTIIT